VNSQNALFNICIALYNELLSGDVKSPWRKIMAEELVSPQLKQLHKALEMGDRAVLDSFWQQVATEGTPLIEPDEANSNFSLVTFLWRGSDETKSVMVQITVDGSGEDEHNMTCFQDTNLWYATFCLRNDFRAAYKFVVNHTYDAEQADEIHDPFNTRTFIEPKDEERPDHTEDDIDSVVMLPDAPAQPWTASRNGIAKGKVERHLFHSRILDNERRIWVYTPPHYKPSGVPYGLLIILDGRFFNFAIRTPMILDNLAADEQILPLIAVMVDNPGNTWQESMAIREKELACHPPFARFLAQEMVPWLRQTYHLTTEPMQTHLAGGSVGGLAAAYAALQHPDTFGNVISLSGSFWWRPEDEVEWEWLTRQFALRPMASLRFYIEVGLLESMPASTGYPGQVLSNRHLRNVLQAKGYEVHYHEQMHGHDSMPWQGMFAEGLIALQESGTSMSNRLTVR
jgi:enterochelin esterase-like enzyme